jgi:nitrate/nitrite-specific signal transduction histidine kinase
MRERAEDVGGHLFVRSLVGRGTTVVLWVPVTGPLGEDLDDGPTGP